MIDTYLKPTYAAYHEEKSRKISKQLNELMHILNGMKHRQNIDFESNENAKKVLDKIVPIVTKKQRDMREIVKVKSELLKVLKAEYKIVSVGYYTGIYMAIGMACGLGFGVAVSQVFFKTIVYLGFGLIIGMVIGMLCGTQADKKAEKQNRVIDIRPQKK